MTGCMECHHEHRGAEPCPELHFGRRCGCRWYVPPPTEAQRAECDITTQWECPFCHERQEVGGAATGWMECGDCLESAWLVPV